VKNHVLSNDGGNIPFNNFIFTANNCYLYNTIVGDIYPIKFWNIELNRDEIKSYTKAIQKLLSQRDAKDIDKVIESFFGSAGNDATYTPSYREEQGSNNRNDVLLEGWESNGGRDNRQGSSAWNWCNTEGFSGIGCKTPKGHQSQQERLFATNGSYRNARGIFRKGYSKNKENVPSLPEVGGSIADSSAEVQGDNINDLLSGNSSGTSSIGKGKNYSENINIPLRISLK